MHHFAEVLESRRLMSTNLVANGSFEKPAIGLGASGQDYTDVTAGQTTITGWKVTSGSVDIVSDTAGGFYRSSFPNGHQGIDMAGTAPGAISQSVATVAGHRYLLKFAYTATPFTTDPGSPALRKLNVGFGGHTLATLSKNETGETPTQPGHKYVTYLVTATSATSAITFTQISPGFLGMAIDDVSLTAVPYGTATISGQVFADGNGDGKKGEDAIGLSGWTVWIDTDGNGVFDTGDLKATTDHFGNFTLTGLAAGTYKVHIIAQTGWKTTTPAIVTVTVATGGKSTTTLFGEEPI